METFQKPRTMTAFLLAACLLAAPLAGAAAQESSGKVLATVGNEKITEADIFAKISMLPPQFRARYETPEGRKKLLEQTIKFSLLSQEAKSLGIDKQEDVAKKIREISDNIIIQELTKQEISDKVTVSEDEIKAHYEQNKASFVRPEKVKVNLILFEVKQDASPEDRKEKKKKADDALKRLAGGEDFEALAKKLSEDKRTNRRGGSTGFFSSGKRKNTYGETFEEKAFSLKKGEMSGVFEDKRGFYIIKASDRKERHEQTLDEVRRRIERTLKQDKQKETYNRYIEDLEKKYPVKRHEENQQ